jgi:CBS-domain-containing membrane protein
VIGIITDRDICLAGRSRTLKLGEMYVHETMTSDVRTCRAGDDVKDAEREMRAARVRRLPVVDEGGRLKGILSLSDIAREAVRERGEAGPEVSALELAVTLAKITEPRTSATRA